MRRSLDAAAARDIADVGVRDHVLADLLDASHATALGLTMDSPRAGLSRS